MAEETSGMPAWMKALGALVLAAAIANGAMVWLSLRGHRDLVRSDYYQAGLEQDGRMARRALAAGYRIDLAPVREGWRVSAETATSGAAGGSAPLAGEALAGTLCRVRFSRPDDGRLDRIAELAWVEGSPGHWQGPAVGLKPGRWDIVIEWEREGKVFMESAFPRYVHE